MSLSPHRLSPLPRSFYLRPTLYIARDLIGCIFVRRIGTRHFSGRIVEVEAYLGEKDPASHAFRGMTPRNSVMFREGGYLYVYFTYGMHFCCNVVTERAGLGRAILIRALEPLEGIDGMRRNRGTGITDRNLCNGPAKLCQALEIGREENSTDLCGDKIFITARPIGISNPVIVRSTRIGISQGKEKLWRFCEQGSAWVSRHE